MPCPWRGKVRPLICRHRVTDVRILRELLLLLLIMALVAIAVFAGWHFWPKASTCKSAATRGNSSLLRSTEGRLRDMVRREVTLDAMREPAVTDGMNRIQARIANAAGTPQQPIEVYVLDSPTINAVSLPGGIIIVYSGLIRLLQAPEELAAILAHEMAHAMHQDAMHTLEREIGLAALFTLASGRSDALTTRLLRRLIRSGFSRQQELDADNEAARILGESDIDPGALAESLRRIQQLKGSDPAILQYVGTHPDLEFRIKVAETKSAAWAGRARPIDIDWEKFRAQFRLLK
jgi:predicted Zn-dependent protease